MVLPPMNGTQLGTAHDRLPMVLFQAWEISLKAQRKGAKIAEPMDWKTDTSLFPASMWNWTTAQNADFTQPRAARSHFGMESASQLKNAPTSCTRSPIHDVTAVHAALTRSKWLISSTRMAIRATIPITIHVMGLASRAAVKD